MKRSPLQDVGDRLGWFAYRTVMGGGIPYWPAFFIPWPYEEEEPPDLDDKGGAAAGTAPTAVAPKGEKIVAA